MTYTDEQIEEGAIALAMFNRGPRIADNVTPRGYWRGWLPEAKENFRTRVRAVLAAVDAGDADAAGTPPSIWTKS